MTPHTSDDPGPLPLEAPFRPADMPASCSSRWLSSKSAWDHYWSVEPATAWEVVVKLRCRLTPSWEGRELDLAPGTSLELTAIRPCTDPNGACGAWQLAQSGFMFRVRSGPHAGAVVELWDSANYAPPGIRPLDPMATVSFSSPFERSSP